MKLQEVYDIIDAHAPFRLSAEFIEKFGAFDNSGVMLDCGTEIRGLLFSLDLSVEAVEKAQKVGADCIVTHHPAIWTPVRHLDALHEEKLFACVKEGISVISAHLNLDAAPQGIDESLMRGLGGKEPVAIYEQLTGGGYGRVFEIKECPIGTFAEKTARVFCTKRITAYGSRPVKRIACFCGAGLDDGATAFAVREGADTIVSSDAKHHLITGVTDKGLNLVLLTHYAAENYGFMRFAEVIRQTVSIPVSTFTDERYL